MPSKKIKRIAERILAKFPPRHEPAIPSQLSDDIHEAMNDIIHEAVFACQHTSQGDVQDTLNCIYVMRDRLESTAHQLEPLKK